jgi:lipopolysaccharide transport system ATP-binding protein
MPNIANISNKVLLMEKGVVDYYGEDISNGIDRYFNEFAGNDPKAEFNDFAELDEMVIHPSAQYAHEEDPIPSIEYLDDIKVDLTLRVKPEMEWFHIKLQITDKDLKIVGIYDSFHLEDPIRNDKEVHHLQVVIPKSIFINGEYGMTLFVQQRDTVNKKWHLLAIYRYWKKFKMKTSEGLGFVPSVVYLPGRVHEKIEIPRG